MFYGWLIDELITLSPANHNDYRRTEMFYEMKSVYMCTPIETTTTTNTNTTTTNNNTTTTTTNNNNNNDVPLNT